MEWTDRHCRFFHRLMTRRALLYTEMLTTGAVIHGDRARLLAYRSRPSIRWRCSSADRDPRALAACARIGADLGFDEINLNCRLPVGPRAKRQLRRLPDGRAGAGRRLRRGHEGGRRGAGHGQMPHRHRRPGPGGGAARCLRKRVEQAGADALIVHARKAWLQGLSPKENRDVPPLDYDRVHRLKAAHPRLTVVLNGGLADAEAAHAHLGAVDGVMLGRAAYQEPWRLLNVDPLFFGEPAPFGSPKAAALALIPYIERELAHGTRLHAITRHLHGLFHAVPGARAFRRHLAGAPGATEGGAAFFAAALALVRDEYAVADVAA